MTKLTLENTAKELTNELNILRVKNGKKELKSCRDSKATILKNIKIETLILAIYEPETMTKEENKKEITAAYVANLLNKSQLYVRRYFRKFKNELPEPIESGKWAFPYSKKEQVLSIFS